MYMYVHTDSIAKLHNKYSLSRSASKHEIHVYDTMFSPSGPPESWKTPCACYQGAIILSHCLWSCQTTSAHSIFREGCILSTPPFASREPCSFLSIVHYSFDMAQQIHYPSNPLQTGPIYFLTPRKCAIFGICCEAIPRQINYLIDEACDTGKGSTPSLAYSITSSKCMVWESVRYICMPTIVSDKTKITPCCTSYSGAQLLACITRSLSHF